MGSVLSPPSRSSETPPPQRALTKVPLTLLPNTCPKLTSQALPCLASASVPSWCPYPPLAVDQALMRTASPHLQDQSGGPGGGWGLGAPGFPAPAGLPRDLTVLGSKRRRHPRHFGPELEPLRSAQTHLSPFPPPAGSLK